MRTILPFHPALARHSLRVDPPMSDAQFEEFVRLNDPSRVERIGKGLILMNAPAGGDTGSGNLDISYQLQAWWMTHRRGRAYDSSTGFYLPDGSMLNPDASCLTAESFAKLTRQQRKGFPPICPDFVIELRSESDRLGDLKKKMQRWLVNGVQLGWLIDPEKQEVFVYRPGAPELGAFTGSILAGSGPVEGFCLDLQEVWGCYVD